MNLVDMWSYHISPGTKYHVSPALRSCGGCAKKTSFFLSYRFNRYVPYTSCHAGRLLLLLHHCCSIQLLLFHITRWCCSPWRSIPGASRGRKEAFLVGGNGPSLCWGAEAALASPAKLKLCGLNVTLCASVNHDCPDKQGRRLIKFLWLTFNFPFRKHNMRVQDQFLTVVHLSTSTSCWQGCLE